MGGTHQARMDLAACVCMLAHNATTGYNPGVPSLAFSPTGCSHAPPPPPPHTHTQVVRHADAIKALDAQAQGEAVIRKALTELKMWGYQREFTFTESTQSVSKPGGGGGRSGVGWGWVCTVRG